MEQHISNPMPVATVASPPLPQHTVDLSPPRTVRRKGSVAEMLMRLTTHTASSRSKAREPRSVSSPQQQARPHPLKSSQSMRSLRSASGSPSARHHLHMRTSSNPGTMPPISRPIALPVGFSPTGRPAISGSVRHVGVRSPALRPRESSSPSLLSDSSSASGLSADSSNASSISIGKPRRPAPLPPTQATALQPRKKRGPGMVSPPRPLLVDRKPGSAPPQHSTLANRPVITGAGSPEPRDDSLSRPKTRKTPKASPRGPEGTQYIKRSPRLPHAGKGEAVGLGLDLGTKLVHKRVASAPAPPSGHSATQPRAMSHIIPQKPQLSNCENPSQQTQQQQQQQPQKPKQKQQGQEPAQALAQVQPQQDGEKIAESATQSPPVGHVHAAPQVRESNQGQRAASSPAHRERDLRSPPLNSRSQGPAQAAQPGRQQPRQLHQRREHHQHQPEAQRAISRTQQMRERVAELQSFTKQAADPKAKASRSPILNHTANTDYYSPSVSPLNTPRMNGGSSSPLHGQDQSQELARLRQKLSQLEMRYNALREQREQDVRNLQNVNSQLITAQASRDSLQQQVSAYQHAQHDMQRRIDALQKSFTRSQRLVRVLGANLEDSKVALEEKNMENYALRRCVSRAARVKSQSGEPGLHSDSCMLSPPNSISDAAEIEEQDSDTPTLKA